MSTIKPNILYFFIGSQHWLQKRSKLVEVW